jgi:citrate lyase synthetase
MNDIRITQILKNVDKTKLPDYSIDPSMKTVNIYNKNNYKKQFKSFGIKLLVNITIVVALILIYYIYR